MLEDGIGVGDGEGVGVGDELGEGLGDGEGDAVDESAFIVAPVHVALTPVLSVVPALKLASAIVIGVVP